MSPFDYLNAIMQNKKQLIVDEETEREYSPFMVNRGLSYHKDCIMYANEMNKLPNADRNLQYHFYLNSIRAYKRPFQKWQKREVAENLDILKEYYQCSNEKAKEILSVLNDEQIYAIKKKIDKKK